MTTTTRTAFAAAILTGTLAFGFAHRSAMAHTDHQYSLTLHYVGAYYNINTDQVEPFICATGTQSHTPTDTVPFHAHGLYLPVA